MADTRIIEELAGAGMTCTIAGNKITFPVPVRGPYTTSNFIINLTKDEGKAITAITATAGYTDSYDDVTVGSIDTWVDTDRYALALTNQPTLVYGTITTAWAAAANNDEIVVYPERDDAYFVRDALSASGAKSGIRIRGFSSVRKITWMGQTVCIDQVNTSNNDITVEDFHLRSREICIRQNNASAVFGAHAKRCTFNAPSDEDQDAGFIANASASGSTFRADNCVFYACRAGVETRASTTAVTLNFCLFLHCFIGVRKTTANPVCTNCVSVLTRSDYNGGITGGSFNVSQDGSAPGTNVIKSNANPEADLKLTYFESPVSGIDSWPLDFRTIDGKSSILENAGTTVSGVSDDIDGRTRHATTPNAGPTEGFLGYGDAGAAIPAAPKITSFAVASGSITPTIDGDAGITNEAFYRLSGVATPTSGGTRTDDGTIPISGLTDNLTYQVFAQSKNASGAYGPASEPIYATPRTSDETPTGAIAAYLAGFRDQLLGDSDYLAWIQTVNPSGTTGGNVFLGYDPLDAQDPAVEGPNAFVRWESYNADLAGGSRTFRSTVDIVLDFVWSVGAADRAADTYILEMSFLSKILTNLINDIDITLDSTFGGHLVAVRALDAIDFDPNDRTLRHSEIRFTIGFGQV